jgi:antitoxin component of MazEF toxin-antitoxin module
MKGKEGFIRYIRKTGTSLGINIPLEIIKILNLKENEIVRVTIKKIKKGAKKTKFSGIS